MGTRITTPWVEVTIRIYPSCITWRGPLPSFGDRPGVAILSEPMADGLALFLKNNVTDGQEAELAINAGLRHIVVRIDDELALTCTFDELATGVGGSTN